MKGHRCKTFPDTNCLFVTFQILWPLNTMNCGVLRPQIASLWSMVTRLSVLDLVKIGRGYWLYLHERTHMQYVSRHKLSLCDLSNIVSFWHNELWCPPTTNKLSVTFYPSNSTQKYCPNMNFTDYIFLKEDIANVSRHKLFLCDLSNIVTFGHNELWCPPTTNSLSVT